MTTGTSNHAPDWLEALRRNRWPDAERVRIVAVFSLIAYLPMMAHVFLQAIGNVGSDFLAFWGAGRLVVAGHASGVFDLAAEHAAQLPSHTGQMVAYVNPPPYLFLVAPLGWLSYPAAWLAWAFGGWLVWFWVCRRMLPGHGWIIAAWPGAYLAASHAQNGFVTGVLLVAGVVSLARGREGWAGALFGLLVIKPHLALLVPLWLLAGGRWRALVAGAASAVLLCVASLVVFGWSTWAAWPQSFQVSAVLMAQTGGEFFLRMATPYALVREWLGATPALVIQGVVTLAMAALVWRATRRHGANLGTGALMLAATAIASPYLFSYDFPFLILPTVWLVDRARARGWMPFEKLFLIGVWLSPMVARSLALPLHANLMPVAGAVMVWAVWRELGSAPSR